MNRRSKFRWALIGLLALVSIGAVLFSPQLSRANFSSPQSPRIAQELARTFKKYELLKLDRGDVARTVRQTGRLSLATSKGTFELVLKPHDLRSPQYAAVATTPGGARRELFTELNNIYKGRVDNSSNSAARFSIDETRLEGMIYQDGEYYFIEPARRFADSARTNEMIFYKSSDVVYQSETFCPVMASKSPSALNLQITPQATAPFSPMRTIELATEADHEYVTQLGGASNALSDIMSIMNQVEGVYEVELGLTFQIVFQHVWETANDPYSTTSDSIQIFNEFRTHWNANFTNVTRDVAHMWTGKNMGGVLGRGSQSDACLSTTSAYGISRLDDRIPLKYNTPAHEIGHNLGATHADSISECTGSIMRPTTTSGLTFCAFSRGEIRQYIEQFGGCISALPSPAIRGQVVDINGRPIAGVEIRLSGSQFRMTTTDSQGRFTFENLSSGSNYIVTPLKSNYAFSPQEQRFDNLTAEKEIFFTVVASPDGPILVTVKPSARALAFDSVTFMREPFPLSTDHNFSSDHRTRLLLFGVNVFLAGEDLSAVKVQAENGSGGTILLPVESMNKVPNFEWLTQLVVRLPDEMAPGDYLLSINLRNVVSNKGLVSIRP